MMILLPAAVAALVLFQPPATPTGDAPASAPPASATPAQSAPASAAPPAPAPAPTPAATPSSTTPTNRSAPNQSAGNLSVKGTVDPEFRPLLDKFNRLHQSLMGRRGIAAADHPTIEAFRNEAREFLKTHPNDTRAIAMLITLSAWLQDNHEVDALYKQLVELRPDDAKIRISWAGHLRNLNRFTESKQVLEGAKIDPATDPTAAKWIVDALIAAGRYDEALTELAKIPTDAIAADPKLQQEMTQLRPALEALPAQWETEKALRESETAADDLPRAELITDKGRIVVELFENQAPNTVANFITLAESGYYDGTRFHRVIPIFMAQGGDPNSKPGSTGVAGSGGPGYVIADEVSRDDHRLHFPGSLALAKTAEPNTGGSQFYLTITATPWLNDKHTVFGRVLEGLEVVRALEPDDTLTAAKVIRKRPHEYIVEKLPEPEQKAAAIVPGPIPTGRPAAPPRSVPTPTPPPTPPPAKP